MDLHDCGGSHFVLKAFGSGFPIPCVLNTLKENVMLYFCAYNRTWQIVVS